MSKADRLESANEFIRAISIRGRRFFGFEHDDGHIETARFKIGTGGHVYFWNEWKMKWIYVSRYGPYRGFHHGGTLHSVVSGLVDFIKSGSKVFNPEFFNASHWSYPLEQSNELVAIGQRLGIIRESQ